MTAADFRELVYASYGGIPKTPPAVRQGLATLDRQHNAKHDRDEKTWYQLLQQQTRQA